MAYAFNDDMSKYELEDEIDSLVETAVSEAVSEVVETAVETAVSTATSNVDTIVETTVSESIENNNVVTIGKIKETTLTHTNFRWEQAEGDTHQEIFTLPSAIQNAQMILGIKEARIYSSESGTIESFGIQSTTSVDQWDFTDDGRLYVLMHRRLSSSTLWTKTCIDVTIVYVE